MKTVQTEMEQYLSDLDNLLDVGAIPKTDIGEYTFHSKNTTLKDFIRNGREFIRRYLMVFRGLLDYGDGGFMPIEDVERLLAAFMSEDIEYHERWKECLGQAITATINELEDCGAISPIDVGDIGSIARNAAWYFTNTYMINGTGR